MSACFIIKYAGAPVRFANGQMLLADERTADKFVSEPEAWWAAYAHDLSPNLVTVVGLSQGDGKTANLQPATSNDQ